MEQVRISYGREDLRSNSILGGYGCGCRARLEDAKPVRSYCAGYYSFEFAGDRERYLFASWADPRYVVCNRR
jgi:hypothetical protein